MKTIKIKVNKVVFEIDYGVARSFVGYSLSRNNKTLIASSMPKIRFDEVKMNIYRDLQEAIGYEIRNEIEKLK